MSDVECRERAGQRAREYQWPDWLSNWILRTAGVIQAFKIRTTLQLKLCTVFQFYFDFTLSNATQWVGVWCATLTDKQNKNRSYFPEIIFLFLIPSGRTIVFSGALFLIDDFSVEVNFIWLLPFGHRRNSNNAFVEMRVQRFHCVFLFKCVMMFALSTINCGFSHFVGFLFLYIFLFPFLPIICWSILQK